MSKSLKAASLKFATLAAGLAWPARPRPWRWT